MREIALDALPYFIASVVLAVVLGLCGLSDLGFIAGIPISFWVWRAIWWNRR